MELVGPKNTASSKYQVVSTTQSNTGFLELSYLYLLYCYLSIDHWPCNGIFTGSQNLCRTSNTFLPMCDVLLSQLLYILFQFPRCKHGICAEKKCSGILQAQSCTKKCSAFYTRMWIFPSGSFCIFALLQALLSVVYNTWCFVIITTTCEILSFRPPFFAYSFPSIFCCCWAFCLLNRLLGYMFPYTRTHIHIWSWQLPSQPIAVDATTKTTYNLLHFKYFCSKN